jgi:methyltransferase (TIGR00027 family)
MPRIQPVIRTISDTSLWTAALRAQETEAKEPVFRDPFARRLAGERGFEIVRTINRPAVRYGVVVRTAGIDEVLAASVRDRGCDVVLDLAAGLDARPWRMDLPSDLRWIDVDFPAVLDYKEGVLADETPRCRYEAARLDLADVDARRDLFARVGAGSSRVVILTEGLLSYLEPEAVGSLAQDLHEPSSFAEWVTDITGSQVADRVKNAGSEHRPVDAQLRFSPEDGTAFFAPYGWTEAEYVDLFMESGRLGRDSVSGRILRGMLPWLPAKIRKSLERGLGVVRLERQA